MWCRDGCERADRFLDSISIRWRQNVAAVEPTHAVRDDVRLLISIENAGRESRGNLVTQLVSPKLDTASWIQLRHMNPHALFSKVLSDSPKIFNSELFAESEDTVDQDDVHSGHSQAFLSVF